MFSCRQQILLLLVALLALASGTADAARTRQRLRARAKMRIRTKVKHVTSSQAGAQGAQFSVRRTPEWPTAPYALKPVRNFVKAEVWVM